VETESGLEAFANSLAQTLQFCEDPPLALVLLDELATGKPVSPAALAVAAGRDETEVAAALARWPTVQLDEQLRVVAFSGLSLAPTAHRFGVAGEQLYAWCAWDTLFLPVMLGRPADVASRCPVTGAEVRLTVLPDGVRSLEPQELSVSFPQPAAASPTDITGSFCCHVHFLAGRAAAERWSSDQPDGRVLPLEDA
jgi:alkylmercury lyase